VGGTFVGRESVVYCGEQLLDIYEPEVSRTSTAVVLWHGRGANEREALEPLARHVAGGGVRVMVPDWSTDDDADGRNHLTASLSFVLNSGSKERPVTRVVLAGWSLGASAGLDLLCHAEAFGGWRPDALVCISGGFHRSPYSPEQPSDSSVDPSVPLVLIHGASDEVVPPERSRVTFDRLLQEGWNVTLREVATDHAGAIGTVFDPARHRCVPTDDPGRQEALVTVAGVIADLALAG
jgi:predicted esterase